MSTAFDTVHVNMLMNILHHHFSFRNDAWSGFRSYLIGLTQQVRVGNASLAVVPLQYGVPQGSILAPMLYSLYTHPLQTILKRHEVGYHKFVDYVVLHTFFNPSATDDLEVALSRLKEAFSDARAWLLKQRLQLNDSKTEYLCVMSPSNVAKYGRMAIQLDKMCIASGNTVKLVCAFFYLHLNMNAQVNNGVLYLQLFPTPNRKNP